MKTEGDKLAFLEGVLIGLYQELKAKNDDRLAAIKKGLEEVGVTVGKENSKPEDKTPWYKKLPSLEPKSKPEPTEFTNHLCGQCEYYLKQRAYCPHQEKKALEEGCKLFKYTNPEKRIDGLQEQLKDKHTISSEDAEHLRKVYCENIDLKVEIERLKEELYEHTPEGLAEKANKKQKDFEQILKEDK